MTRWEALVRFDDEIREAATKLIPFGPTWVVRLGEAFFALNEDRKYLPNIVARLTEEAMLEALDAEQAASMEWLASLRTTKDGETTNKEALTVLIELRARGYRLTESLMASLPSNAVGAEHLTGTRTPISCGWAAS